MRYKVNGVEYDANSNVNQKIKGYFIEREVFYCMTSEVEYIIRKSFENCTSNDLPFTEDDIENYYGKSCNSCGCESFTEVWPDDPDVKIEKNEDEDIVSYKCPCCGMEHETETEARECCNQKLYKCDDCGRIYTEDEYYNLDDSYPEVFEWWAVTDWFGEKLKRHGETVISCVWGKTYWGRQTTGQAILLDYVVSKICCEMEILQGQAYSWEGRT